MIVEPTVLNRDHQNRNESELPEVFGPVVTVEPYRDFDEGVASGEQFLFGLQAGLFTRDAKVLFQAYEERRLGGYCRGTCPHSGSIHMPYGGVKDSGAAAKPPPMPSKK